MAALFLSEDQVDDLLTMEQAIDAVTTVFRKQALTEVANVSRNRARTDLAMLHMMGAAAKSLNAMCCKIYTTCKKGAQFYVHLFDGRSGELLAIMEASRLGALRTGAASAVATRCMARPESNTVGILGSGFQARSQLEAACQVLDVEEVYVYSPNADRRDAFAAEMSSELAVKVVGVGKPELAVEDKDVVITATNSVDPVLRGEWIGAGTHINAIGSNFLGRAELDVATVRLCDPIVVDDKEQARMEAGDFVKPMEEGVVRWSDIEELSDVLVDRVQGRHSADGVTLFKSVGIGMEDLAVARLVYDQAVEQGVGTRLPF